MAAVTQNGLALKHAHKTLKKNHDIVLMAVQQNGMALKFAHSTLQEQTDIVEAAVKQNPGSFVWASEKLCNDEKIINLAFAHDKKLLMNFQANGMSRQNTKSLMASKRNET